MRLNKLKQIREQNFLTQAELAEKSGITRETVNRIENGKGTHVKVARIIASALGVKPQELI